MWNSCRKSADFESFQHFVGAVVACEAELLGEVRLLLVLIEKFQGGFRPHSAVPQGIDLLPATEPLMPVYLQPRTHRIE